MDGIIVRSRGYRDGWYEGGLDFAIVAGEEPMPILSRGMTSTVGQWKIMSLAIMI